MEEIKMILKKTAVWMSAAAVLACTAAIPVSADAAKQNDIVILYTNDVHSGIDEHIGYDGLMLYKREMEAQHAHVILADAGDAIQGGNAANLTNGKNIVDLMNLVGYDVAVLGNHEFDYGIPVIQQRAAELNCPRRPSLLPIRPISRMKTEITSIPSAKRRTGSVTLSSRT